MATYGMDPELMRLLQEQGMNADELPTAGGALPTDPFGLSQMFEGAPSYIPQSSVPQIQDPAGLQALMGGQGYDPAILAQMHASATEGVAHNALPALSQLNRGLSSAGQYNSPAGAAMRAVIGRQTGDATTAANREVDIRNADVGNQNRQFGLNLAHSTAMQQANMLFQSLSQNAAEAGSNFRSGLNVAFGQNPANPGGGTPQQSQFGPSLTGAAQQIGQATANKPQAQTPSMPSDTANQPPQWNPEQGTPPFVGNTLPTASADRRPQPFAQNPYRGY